VKEFEKKIQIQIQNYVRLKREENTQRTMWAKIDENFKQTLQL